MNTYLLDKRAKQRIENLNLKTEHNKEKLERALTELEKMGTIFNLKQLCEIAGVNYSVTCTRIDYIAIKRRILKSKYYYHKGGKIK